ncbi:SDR family oxidoreductase [Planctomicrobium sp. SH664]|uniref:SDR family oxidoreductase n=1 Tax=Planctomicrobium sp. SH664 TaxID=3448125 RepID=UPI003F5BA4D5
MKIVVIGGSGLIGSQVVHHLRERGHDAVAASPSRGINAVTGEGLEQALAGSEVVIDVSNPPSFDDQTSLHFFEVAGRNLKSAEQIAGVQHHIVLSVVGTERLQEMGYFRAKLKQEELIKDFGIPYTIVRATQFFEFTETIAQSGMNGKDIRLPSVLMQPIAANDVAVALADTAMSPPVNGMIELAGPEVIRMDELVRRFLTASGENHEVLADPQAYYFSTPVDDGSLMPSTAPLTGMTRFSEWLEHAFQRTKTG